MSSPQLPNFERSLRLSQGSLDAAELAECHGILCGWLSVHPQSSPQDYFRQLAELHVLDEPGEALRLMLTDLFHVTLEQLQDQEMGFRLWLPEDNEPLEERTESLARWCTGLLAGLACEGSLRTLSREAAEAVTDLEQIARAGLSSSGNEQELESDEKAFAEISEYVRVVTMMLREDFRGPGDEDAIH